MTALRIDSLRTFQNANHIAFGDLSLLDRALTHRSCMNERPAGREGPGLAGRAHDNETLEFLGDSVLGLVVARMLFAELDGRPEGDLARIKSWVVSEASLAPIAVQIGIAPLLVLGKGEERSGGRAKKAILADALEALFGALFLDSGFEAAAEFIARALRDRFEEALASPRRDFKTRLQEALQRDRLALPVYSIIKAEGPEHERRFIVSCRLADGRETRGEGLTRKDAEQEAARVMCGLVSSDSITPPRSREGFPARSARGLPAPFPEAP